MSLFVANAQAPSTISSSSRIMQERPLNMVEMIVTRSGSLFHTRIGKQSGAGSS